MALDQSALLDLLGALKLTDVTDRIRVATETLYQELIDAEATAFIGPAPFERFQARVGHRIVSQAIVVGVGVAADGRREVLGFDVGDSANEGFWTAFLRSLKTPRPGRGQAGHL